MKRTPVVLLALCCALLSGEVLLWQARAKAAVFSARIHNETSELQQYQHMSLKWH